MAVLYLSIGLAIISSALYHFAQKEIPAGANPLVSVIVTYVVALVLCGILVLLFPPQGGMSAAFGSLNWSTYVLALAIVGLETGYLLVYRAGWNIGLAAILVNVAASLILVPLALYYFKETLSWINLLGVVICLVGLIMINWQR